MVERLTASMRLQLPLREEAICQNCFNNSTFALISFKFPFKSMSNEMKRAKPIREKSRTESSMH